MPNLGIMKYHETYADEQKELTLSESVPLFLINLLVPLNDSGEYATVNIPLLPLFSSNTLHM